MTNKVDLSPLVTRLNNLNVLTNRLADVIVRDSDQYVPFLNGYLAGHVSRIQTGTGVTIVWTEPYAAYMYGGKVMVKAPDTMGQRRGYHKVVTNRPLNYNHTKHALAQKGWVDKAYLVNGHNWAALVPFLNGYLAGHVSRIQTGTGVTIVWTEPYAAYMYGGKVMVKAPDTMGQRRGYHKVVTNRPLNYNHTKHALAQKGWVDKAYLVNGHNPMRQSTTYDQLAYCIVGCTKWMVLLIRFPSSC
ncbi:hypothetical protein WP50_16490 [Lactiplantibacillus plantarum]|nr:hypothetical protein WP50_16490 [Lactiplantibacillus plantarum]